MPFMEVEKTGVKAAFMVGTGRTLVLFSHICIHPSDVQVGVQSDI